MITILKNPANLCFANKSAYVRFKTSYANGAKPDLKGMVQVEKTSNGSVLDTQQARYHPSTRETAIDIQPSFLDLKEPLPPDSTLQVATTPYHTLTDSFQSLKCRIWDRYEETPFEDAPAFSDEFNVIFGDTPVPYITNPTYNNSITHICHRYPNGYRKTITPYQADFVFLTTPLGYSNCSVEVTVFMSNGQYHTSKIFEEIEIPANQLLAFPSGFGQLNLFNRIKSSFPSYDVYPTSYIFSIFCNELQLIDPNNPQSETMPRYMIANKSYILDGRVPEETIYIAYENGLGGIETQYFPIHQKRRESEKELADLMLFDEADKRQGEKVETKISYYDRYTVKSLVLNRTDLENMQRIIHSPIWLIHPTHFERVYVDSKTVDAPPSHARAGHFTFSYKRYL